MKYFKHQMLSAILEEIRMKDGESFDDFYVKLNDIVNSSFNMGERILEMKIVKNVLKSLLERFKPKATVINKSKDLNMIKLVELDGSLQTDELTISYSKKNKSVALNTIREENYDTTDTDAFNDEVVAYFVQKFKKVFKNKRIPRINTKVALVNSGRIIREERYYGCQEEVSIHQMSCVRDLVILDPNTLVTRKPQVREMLNMSLTDDESYSSDYSDSSSIEECLNYMAFVFVGKNEFQKVDDSQEQSLKLNKVIDSYLKN